jgi:hypothetical protein
MAEMGPVVHNQRGNTHLLKDENVEINDQDTGSGRVGILVHLARGETKQCALKAQSLRLFPNEETVMVVRLGTMQEL